MKKKAFTLAEVLITLGVIGIVAALTMPALIANYQKKQTVTQLQKIYSVLNQAVQLASVDHGAFELKGGTLADFEEYWNTYFAPYLKTVKTCVPFSQCNISMSDYKYLTGTAVPAATVTDSNGGVAAVLPDGGMIILRINDGTIFADVNGHNKGPNQYGKDMFLLNIKDSSRVVFWGAERTREQISGDNYIDNYYRCDRDSAAMGEACGSLIQMDGWEIKDDYPW